MQEDSPYATERLTPEVVPQSTVVQPMRRDRTRLVAYLLIGFGLALLVRNLTFGTVSSGQRSFNEPLGVAARVHLRIDNGNGDMTLGSNSEAQTLISGNVNGQGQIVYDAGHDGRERTIKLSTKKGGWFGWGGTALQLNLNPKPVYDLEIDTGDGSDTLDLSQLTITELNVNTGNGRNELQLPAQGALTGKVELGNGSLVITVPQGRAVRLQIEHGNGQLQPGPLRATTTSGQDGTYQTAGFDSVPDQNRIDLHVQVGNGAITVQ